MKPHRFAWGGWPMAAVLFTAALLSPAHGAGVTSSAPPICYQSIDELDVDAMAARIPFFQDTYKKTRDEALAVYAKNKATPQQYDERVRRLIRLMTYLQIFDDIYHEGLWDLARTEAADLNKTGSIKDPFIQMTMDLTYSSKNYRAHADTFATTDYPDVFKISCYSRCLNPENRFILPDLIPKWGAIYERLIRSSLPHHILFSIGHNALCTNNNFEGDITLSAIQQEYTRAFEAAGASDHPTKAALDGSFWTFRAWLVRGNGWADSVREDQWADFRVCLGKADEILEAGYQKHPEDGDIPCDMLSVELGQGQGVDRMELWFQRAIKADPNNSDAYAAKFWYLQPRWYGSEEALLAFGQKVLEQPNWGAAIPPTFGVAIAQAQDQDKDLYARPDVWASMDKLYLGILEHSPRSAFFRTYYALHAIQGKHWDVAREQLDLLGDHYDRSVMTEAQHSAFVDLVTSKTPGAGK